MMWRIAPLDPDGALVAEAGSAFEEAQAAPPLTELSVIGLLKQYFWSDEQLADRLQDGDAEALTVLFKRYSALVYGISRRVLRNDAEAEDALQQIFLDVFRSIHQFDSDKGSFKTWLLMFAYHRTFNCRRSQISSKFFQTDPLKEGLTHFHQARRGQSSAENSVLVRQVLSSLQPRQRRTIELVYYEGLTAEEVSIKTGESVRVVRHNLYRGLDKLRKALCPESASPKKPEVEG